MAEHKVIIIVIIKIHNHNHHRQIFCNELFEGLRSLKAGVDHMVIHDGMVIHAGIMNRDIQNDLYNALIELHTTGWGRIIISFPSFYIL